MDLRHILYRLIAIVALFSAVALVITDCRTMATIDEIRGSVLSSGLVDETSAAGRCG